jgi:hypothetical protein
MAALHVPRHDLRASLDLPQGGKRRWLVDVMTLTLQSCSIATTAASIDGPRPDRLSLLLRVDVAT